MFEAALWTIAFVLFIVVLFHSLGATWDLGSHPNEDDPVRENIRDDRNMKNDL